jgi:hypothetical protein
LQLHLLNKIFHLCFLIRMVEAEKFRHSEMKFYDQQKLFEMKSYDPRKVFHSSVNRLWLKPVWLEPKPIFQTQFFLLFHNFLKMNERFHCDLHVKNKKVDRQFYFISNIFFKFILCFCRLVSLLNFYTYFFSARSVIFTLFVCVLKATLVNIILLWKVNLKDFFPFKIFCN